MKATNQLMYEKDLRQAQTEATKTILVDVDVEGNDAVASARRIMEQVECEGFDAYCIAAGLLHAGWKLRLVNDTPTLFVRSDLKETT